MLRKILLAGILVAATVLVVILLNQQSQPPEIIVPETPDDVTPGDAARYSTQGFRLTWNEWITGEQDGSILTHPMIVMGDKSKDSRIVITARQSWCDHDKQYDIKKGILRGNVVVRQYVDVPAGAVFDREQLEQSVASPLQAGAPTPQAGPRGLLQVVMTTEELSFDLEDPDAGGTRVWTDKPFFIDGLDMSMRGIGFEARDDMALVTIAALAPYGAVLYNQRMALPGSGEGEADTPPAPAHIHIHATGKLIFDRRTTGPGTRPGHDLFRAFKNVKVRQISPGDLHVLASGNGKLGRPAAGLDAEDNLQVTLSRDNGRITGIDATSETLRKTYLFTADGRRAWVERFVFAPDETVLESRRGLAVQMVDSERDGKPVPVTLNDFTRMTVLQATDEVGQSVHVTSAVEGQPVTIDQAGRYDIIGATVVMHPDDKRMTVIGNESVRAQLYPKALVGQTIERTGDYLIGDRIVVVEDAGVTVTGDASLHRGGQFLTGPKVVIDNDERIRVEGAGTLLRPGGVLRDGEAEASGPPRYTWATWNESMTYGGQLVVLKGKVNVIEKQQQVLDGTPVVKDGQPVLVPKGIKLSCGQLDMNLAEKKVPGTNETRTEILRMVAQDDVVVVEGGVQFIGDRLVRKQADSGPGMVTQLFGSPDGDVPARALLGQMRQLQDQLVCQWFELHHDTGTLVGHGKGSTRLTAENGSRIEAWWTEKMTMHELDPTRKAAQRQAEPGTHKIILLGNVRTVQHDPDVKDRRTVVTCKRMHLFMTRAEGKDNKPAQAAGPLNMAEMELVLTRAFDDVVVTLVDPKNPGKATGDRLTWRKQDSEIVLVGSPEAKARARSGQNLIVGPELTLKLFPESDDDEAAPTGGDIREVFVRGPGHLDFVQSSEARKDDARMPKIHAVWAEKAYLSMEKNVAFFTGQAELTRRTEVVESGDAEVERRRPVVDVLEATEQIQVFFREVVDPDDKQQRTELQRIVGFGPRPGDVLWQRGNQQARGSMFVYEADTGIGTMTNADGTPVKVLDVESGVRRGGSRLIVRDRVSGDRREVELQDRPPRLGDEDPFGFREVLD